MATEFAAFVSNTLIYYSTRIDLIANSLSSAVELSCGSASSENCTYLVETTTTAIANPCEYSLCRSSPNICRIRLDFTVRTVSHKYSGIHQLEIRNSAK